MGKALLERVPDKVLLKVMGDLLAERDISKIPHDEHWADLISDKELFFALIEFYFPDQREVFLQLKDSLTEDSCEDVLRHGIPFRYGHLEGVREQYLMALLLEDYPRQEQLMQQHPVECVTMCYVSERGE